jgi:hypothetical protein
MKAHSVGRGNGMKRLGRQVGFRVKADFVPGSAAKDLLRLTRSRLPSLFWRGR